MQTRAFHLLRDDLPRQGPGLDLATGAALQRLPALPASAQVVDVASGTGRSTLVLARQLKRSVLAVEGHAPFRARLEQEAKAQGLGAWVRTQPGEPLRPGVPPASVDLLWCEWAVQQVGFPHALNAWGPLLGRQGLVVVSDLAWLGAERPAEAATFWRARGPFLTDVDGHREAATQAGYELLLTLPLPVHAWFQEYLDPLRLRAEALRSQAAKDPELAAAIVDAEREVETCQRHAQALGCVFFVLQKGAPSGS